MTIKVSVLPEEIYTPELARFIDDLMLNVQTEIDSVNGVAIRKEVPDRPREGKIYYLTEDLNNIVTEGYWALINDQWHKFAMIDDIDISVSDISMAIGVDCG